jgi:hypothetical protein
MTSPCPVIRVGVKIQMGEMIQPGAPALPRNAALTRFNRPVLSCHPSSEVRLLLDAEAA